MLYYYGIDWFYIILVLPALIFCMVAQARVNSTFSKYSNVPTRRGLTGHDAARAMLDREGLRYVRIECIRGRLTDHYDPRTETVCLSDAVYNCTSVAAVGVACHEAGHAIQHSEEYGPLRVRTALLPAVTFASRWWIFIFLIGALLSIAPLAYAGVVIFGVTTLFQLATLPVEFNASRRALAAIEASGVVSRDELASSRRVLSAAAMTYVAALALSLAHFIRLLARVSNLRDD